MLDTVVANEIVSGMVWRKLRHSELKYGSVLRNLDIFWAIYILRSYFSFIASKSRTVIMFFLVLIILVL